MLTITESITNENKCKKQSSKVAPEKNALKNVESRIYGVPF